MDVEGEDDRLITEEEEGQNEQLHEQLRRASAEALTANFCDRHKAVSNLHDRQ
jgi:hypothetical protein